MQSNKRMWHPKITGFENIYVAFQAGIQIEEAGNPCEMSIFGSSAYRAYVDGEEVIQGPARFDKGHPEYDEVSLSLKKGIHVLTVIVHYFGVSTRFIASEIPAFLQCELRSKQGIIPLQWLCKELTAYTHTGRRLNGQLGWMEQCDARLLPSFNLLHQGQDWIAPIEISLDLGEYLPKQMGNCQNLSKAGILISQGIYADRFGYRDDDPPVRFMLRDLYPALPADGVWLRYDFGLIGLYYPEITLDVPEGTLVEAGYSEALTDGKVAPFITLSASASCSMDRWMTKEGHQELKTFSPRGFRFLELHIAAPEDHIKLIGVTVKQRTYFASLNGAFHCSDSLLNEIWMMSVKTLQSCSEDALTDTPTRERGQWLGDAVAVGMETISVAFNDLSLIRRGLVQAAYCQREDGMVAGLYPGQNMYVSSYALLWISGCLRYFQHTGDRQLLTELHKTAAQTMDVFFSQLTSRGVYKLDIWDFIDWGHIVDMEEINIALNLLILGALRDLAIWEQELGMTDLFTARQKQMSSFEQMARKTYVTSHELFAQSVPAAGESAPEVSWHGYHANVLGLWLHLFDESTQPKAVDFIKKHLLNCFPNNSDAPRLAHPDANHNRLITPYFMHFTLHALLEAGEVDFVLEQYKACWGWMVEQGATTLLEVFDVRWSHCHAWSGCPAWQLSRHVLGLSPDETGEPLRFHWYPKTGSLGFAEGKLPLLNDSGHIDIQWAKEGCVWIYKLQCERPLQIKLTDKLKIHEIEVDGIRQKSTDSGEIQVSRGILIIFS